MGIANFLTFLRILLIPAFVLVFYLPLRGMHALAASLFACVALTDWLDGYLARSLKQVSKFGAFLDPVADKLMVVTALILLIGKRHLPGLVIPALIIVCREITVSALREWMAEFGKRAKVGVSKISKIKTALQMFSIILLLLYRPPNGWIGFAILGYLLFYTAALLTLWSMMIYLKIAWHELKQS
jgi:CDP-diacylglycerol---glycerol-3-phosphate 3-phosphatidyltransferase